MFLPMRTPVFQVDAFAARRFAGNPAAVMPMEEYPPDAVMQTIAADRRAALWPSREQRRATF
jgi:predicted PhzF superfamily epimerase YddE/YHI9